jgi:2-hydroxy-4-carboxymuconate semialdehyde hemiacetal dehydrogenase
MTAPDITIGFIGPGAIAHSHARALAQLPVRLHSAAGPEAADLTEFAQAHGIAHTYADHRTLLDDPSIDAVIIAAPSSLHAALTLEALAAGKHVLCEIPVAMSADDTDRVVAAARETGLMVAVGHTLRFWEPYVQLSERLAGGGPATNVVMRSVQHRQTNVGWTGKARSWTDNVLWHHGAHAVDATLWFLGAGTVDVRGGIGPVWPGSGAAMDVSATLVTDDDRLGSVTLSYHSRAPKSDILVIAEDATYEIQGGRLFVDDSLVFDTDNAADVQTQAVLAQDRAFVDALRGDTSAVFTAADTVPTMRVLQTLADIAPRPVAAS